MQVRYDGNIHSFFSHVKDGEIFILDEDDDYDEASPYLKIADLFTSEGDHVNAVSVSDGTHYYFQPSDKVLMPKAVLVIG